MGKRHHPAENDIKKAAPGRYQARRKGFYILLVLYKEAGDFVSSAGAPQFPRILQYVQKEYIVLSLAALSPPLPIVRLWPPPSGDAQHSHPSFP